MHIDDEILSQANEFTMVSANDALTLTWYIVQAGGLGRRRVVRGEGLDRRNARPLRAYRE
jgi:hypothetical protein